MRITDIVEGLATRSVDIRGKAWVMRRLSASEQAAFARQWGDPETHERDERGRWVEKNPNDRTLREQADRRELVVKAAMVGAALGIEHPDDKVLPRLWSPDLADERTWLSTYADTLLGVLTLQELNRLYWEELVPLCRGEDEKAREDARKNSSPPRPS